MKRKFNLQDLKVKSFVTSLDGHDSRTIAGGLINVGGVNVDKISIQAGCQSDWQGPCQPSEYMTACQTGDTNCYAEAERQKYAG